MWEIHFSFVRLALGTECNWQQPFISLCTSRLSTIPVSIIHHNHWKLFLNLPFHIICGTGYQKNSDTGENTGYFTSPNWEKIHPEKIMHKTTILVPIGQKTALYFWKQYPLVSHIVADIPLIFFGDQPRISSLYHFHVQRRNVWRCKTIIQHARQ